MWTPVIADTLAWLTFLGYLHKPPDNILSDTFSSHDTDFAKALFNLLTSGAIISLSYLC